MAWTDSCKLAAKETIDNIVKKKEELEDLRTKLEVLIKEVETKING